MEGLYIFSPNPTPFSKHNHYPKIWFRTYVPMYVLTLFLLISIYKSASINNMVCNVFKLHNSIIHRDHSETF